MFAMNIRIAIVDDQAQTRELLRQDLLVRVPDGASIACFDGGEAFLSGFTPGDDALVFLDICMAVSYTHLDVYKRQRYDAIASRFSCVCKLLSAKYRQFGTIPAAR